MNRKPLYIVGGVMIGLFGTFLIAALSIFAYSVFQSFQIDYRNHQAIVELVKYNLQTGHLVPVPAVQPPAVTTPPPPDQPHPATSAPAAKEGKK